MSKQTKECPIHYHAKICMTNIIFAMLYISAKTLSSQTGLLNLASSFNKWMKWNTKDKHCGLMSSAILAAEKQILFLGSMENYNQVTRA